MNWKKFLKPTKGKLILSIIITVLSIIITATYYYFPPFLCETCGDVNYEKWPDIVPECDCTIGASFYEFTNEIISVFMIPFVLTYHIYSVISSLMHKK